jgi:DNA-binding transcriptional LysR family regulator
MDKLASMEMFVRVVESGSFAGAAASAGVSATMAAKHIRTIEDRLGARLLHRTTRRQALTDVGRLYYERCKRALAEVELAESSGSELQAAPKGQLRMVAPVNFGSHSVVPALSRYLARHPDVSVDLTLDDRAPDLLKKGFELGVQVGDIADATLVARPLRPYRRVMAASPAYLAQSGVPERPEDLSSHQCLGMRYWRTYDRWHLIGPAGEPCVVRVTGRLLCNHGQALRVAAVQGLGIALQPEAVVADDLAADRLVRVLPGWSYKPSPMYLIYAQDSRPTAKLRSVIDFLLARFGPRGSEEQVERGALRR